MTTPYTPGLITREESWFPSAAELRRATTARDQTTWTADQYARQAKIPQSWARRFWAEGGR